MEWFKDLKIKLDTLLGDNSAAPIAGGNNDAENAQLTSQFFTEATNISKRYVLAREELAKVMGDLKESTNALGKILKSVNDIASQTHILTINATAAAARTDGSVGKMFAAVAQKSALSEAMLKEITRDLGKIYDSISAVL